MRAKLSVILVVVAALSTSAVAQSTDTSDDLPSLQGLYQEKVARIDEKHTRLLAKVPSDYTNALTAVEQSLTKKGDLDGVVAVRRERDRFREDPSVPPNAVVNFPLELKALQDKFKTIPVQLEAEKRKEISKLTSAYIAKLEQLKKRLTQNTKVDEALLVKAEIDKVIWNVDSTMPEGGTAQSRDGKKAETQPSSPPSIKGEKSEGRNLQGGNLPVREVRGDANLDSLVGMWKLTVDRQKVYTLSISKGDDSRGLMADFGGGDVGKIEVKQGILVVRNDIFLDFSEGVQDRMVGTHRDLETVMERIKFPGRSKQKK